jgi:hypothetical protein
MKIDELRHLPPTLPVEEAGRLIGIGRSAAYAAARSGELPTITIGRRVVVPTPRLLALLGAPVLTAEAEAACDEPPA